MRKTFSFYKVAGLVFLLAIISCTTEKTQEEGSGDNPYVIVLGTVQDGGSPHAGCLKSCCSELFEHPDPTRMVVSLGLVDPKSNSYWLFEASPDLRRQMKIAQTGLQERLRNTPNGIFLTHAHIGHYSGLMFLGKESMNSDSLPVYAMPRMSDFLRNNGPWEQLVNLKNISLNVLGNNSPISLTDELTVTPILVPHRDEYSETVGFKIKGPNKTLLFIPDINKWEIWDKSIKDQLDSVDYAFLDATFFDGNEINNRDIRLIPHPFVIETAKLLQHSHDSIKKKVNFIHFNHTNPLLDKSSQEFFEVKRWGFNIAQFKDKIQL
jgi:pyrroloquinoline quinone biosynthesis protein B